MTVLYINPRYKNIFETLLKRKFSRSPENQLAYSDLLEELKEKNIKVEDYIVERFLNDDKEVVIAPCDFPYDLPDTFRHDVVWMLDNQSSQVIADALNAYYKNENIVACFINEYTRQSVRKVKHAHVIVDIFE